MQQCNKCKHELENEARFCPNCGTEVKVIEDGRGSVLMWVIWFLVFLMLISIGISTIKSNADDGIAILRYGGLILGAVCCSHWLAGRRQKIKRSVSLAFFVVCVLFSGVVQEFHPEIIEYVNRPTAEEIAKQNEARKRQAFEKKKKRLEGMLIAKSNFYDALVRQSNASIEANYLWEQTWNGGTSYSYALDSMRRYKAVHEEAVAVYDSLEVPGGTDEKWHYVRQDSIRAAKIRSKMADLGCIFLQEGPSRMLFDPRFQDFLNLTGEVKEIDNQISSYMGAMRQELETEKAQLDNMSLNDVESGDAI